MGWDWNTYMCQPSPFLEVIDLLRTLEAEEIKRQNHVEN